MVLFCFYTFSTITRCLRRNSGIYVATAIACGPRQVVLRRYGPCTVLSCAGLVYALAMPVANFMEEQLSQKYISRSLC